MTEADWWACRNPYDLLGHLEGRASARKLRLFAGALCRRVGEMAAAKVVERHADGQAGREELERVRARAEQHWRRAYRGHGYNKRRISTSGRAARVAWGAAQLGAEEAALGAAREGILDCREAQCAFLRELFGNPFAPVVVRSEWLGWENGTVRLLAQGIYEEQAFERLPVLADALTDAGCTSEALLRHLSESEGHLLGCWGLDVLLGRQ